MTSIENLISANFTETNLRLDDLLTTLNEISDALENINDRLEKIVPLNK